MKIHLNKIYAVLILILGVACTPSFAQGPPKGEQGPPPIPTEQQIEKMVAELSSELSLNEDQQTRLHGLYVDHFKELNELRGSQEGPREGQRKKMEALRASFEKEVQADFSKEQRELFAAYQAKRGENRMGKRRPRKK